MGGLLIPKKRRAENVREWSYSEYLGSIDASEYEAPEPNHPRTKVRFDERGVNRGIYRVSLTINARLILQFRDHLMPLSHFHSTFVIAP